MFSLLPYNTFGLDVHAARGRLIRGPEELAGRIEEPYLILGRGSDVLFTDDFDGTALISCIKGVSIAAEGSYYKVRVGAGEILDELIVKLLKAGISGLENLSAIPGTVGAAPIQNIGAYGVEIGDFIDSVEALNLDTGERVTLSRRECAFGYRDSYFKQHKDERFFVLYVNFRFEDSFQPRLTYQGLKDQELKDARQVRQAVLALRARKLPDPRFVGNAGSFFKNPVVDQAALERIRARWTDVPVFTAGPERYKLAAGWLIDKADCRGITHGQAGTWEHQALVLVNRGQAKPHEIVSLGKYICAKVKDIFDIELVPEVRLYGRYGEVEWSAL